MSDKPRLRPLDFQAVVYQGQQVWYLRDPLQLSRYQIFMPPALAQMMLFCDGTHTPQEIHAALCAQLGVTLEFQIVADA
ncbi:MAG: hypothetical protein ACE5FD_15715, partial [Anaerolineae bacterium]